MVAVLPTHNTLVLDAVPVNVGTAFTAIVTVFEVAGLPVAQAALLVITQVTVFPFANAAFVYVALLVPTFELFKVH
jgi:uncharacterized membrane protein YccF (DUF307 family)